MDPAEQLNEMEKLKAKIAEVTEAMLPPVAPELVARPPVEDKIAKATRKALDLSDATVSIFNEETLDDRSEFDKVERLFKQYQTNLNRFLQHTQDLLIEGINAIEVLESRWQKMR